MPRPHPAHASRRGLVSCSLMTSWIYLQKVCLVTFDSILGLFHLRLSYLNVPIKLQPWMRTSTSIVTAQSDAMKCTDQFVILRFNTSTNPKIWTCDTRTFLLVWVGWGLGTRLYYISGQRKTLYIMVLTKSHSQTLSKNRKEGLVNGLGWKCTLQNILITAEPSAEPKLTKKRLSS